MIGKNPATISGSSLSSLLMKFILMPLSPINCVEVTFPYDKDEEFSDFQGKDITGTITGATATVDSCLKTTADGKQTYIMFLNNVKGIFKREELVGYVGGTLEPKIVGSLSDISLTAKGTGISVGEMCVLTRSSSTRT